MNRPIKKYAVAVNENNIDYCGSDAYFICDGRWSIPKCLLKAKEHFEMINRNLGKGFYAFHINVGPFPNGTQYSKNVLLL